MWHPNIDSKTFISLQDQEIRRQVSRARQQPIGHSVWKAFAAAVSIAKRIGDFYLRTRAGLAVLASRERQA